MRAIETNSDSLVFDTRPIMKFLTHTMGKNFLNPFTFLLCGVVLLFENSHVQNLFWIKAGIVYVLISVGTQVSIIFIGMKKGWLNDPLAPKACLRPKMYFISTFTSILTAAILVILNSPIELIALCFAQVFGMPLLALTTTWSMRNSSIVIFKASMHVYAATLCFLIVFSYKAFYCIEASIYNNLLIAIAMVGIIVFLCWARVKHVPYPEHSLREVIAGAIIATTSFLFANLACMFI